MRQFAVIGLGRFGSSIAKTLSEKGYQVIAIDVNVNIVQDLSDVVTQAVCVDAIDEKALRALGIKNVDVAIVGIGTNLQASILTTLNLKEMGIKEIICKAVNEGHRKVLERIGATKVIQPERDMGIRLANSLISTRVVEHIELSEDSSIAELVPPKEIVGKSLREADVRAKYGVNVIAIKRKTKNTDKEGRIKEEEKINCHPQATDTIKNGDVLVVIGANPDIEKLKK